MLELRNISNVVEGKVHLYPLDLTLQRGCVNVLLGPTSSGKTSLLRLIAGLDRPTCGTVHLDGRDITKVPIRRRQVAIVYQQFINYPMMTVYENIASPLKLQGFSKQDIRKKVDEVSLLLHLTPYLDRLPANLSGGQQQRVALARALAKKADIILLDEPMANLDYKLREEFRLELPKIFAASNTIFVYATTEPSESLILGGNTVTLNEGRITQFGLTGDVFRNPDNLETARIFSDPPLNIFTLDKKGDFFSGPQALSFPVPSWYSHLEDASYTVGFRPHRLTTKRGDNESIHFSGRVTVTEITGSESFVHFTFSDAHWVMLANGVHRYDADHMIDVFLAPEHLMIFDNLQRAVRPLASE